jgi:hypothetical protein
MYPEQLYGGSLYYLRLTFEMIQRIRAIAKTMRITDVHIPALKISPTSSHELMEANSTNKKE